MFQAESLGRMKTLRPTILLFLVASFPGLASTWDQVPFKFQNWINAHLVSGEETLSRESVIQLYLENEPREVCHISASLFFRNQRHDRVNAQLILNKLLSHQIDKPGRLSNGDWKLRDGSFNPFHNNRRFMGMCLIHIREEFLKNTSYENRRPVNVALKRIAEGEMLRKALVRSSNLPLMQVFILSYAGHLFGNREWVQKGEELATRIYEDIREHNVFMEFNSPTYDGVSLYVLRHWVHYGSTAMVSMGRELEAFLWNDVLSLYNPNLVNLAGPYSRNYSLNLKHYPSFVGFWFPILTRNFDLESFPKNRYSHVFPILFSLGHGLAKEDIRRITHFDGNRIIRKYHPRNVRILNEEMQTTSVIEENFMYGYAKGFNSGRMNHVPFVAHWKNPGSEKINWLHIAGRPNNINVVEGQGEMLDISFDKIPMDRQDHDYYVSITFRHDLEDVDWALENGVLSVNGRTLQIETALGSPRVRVLENNRFGKRMVSLQWFYQTEDHWQNLMSVRFAD